MKQSKPLKPFKVGDRVRVYCATRQLNGAKGTIYCACQNGAAWGVKLDRPTDLAEIPDCYDHQLRRLLPRKAKQDTERVEAILNIREMDGLLRGAQIAGQKEVLGIFYSDNKNVRLVEVRPGERVLSREDLAKAWESVLTPSAYWHGADSGGVHFQDFCTALGLGLSKEGGKK